MSDISIEVAVAISSGVLILIFKNFVALLFLRILDRPYQQPQWAKPYRPTIQKMKFMAVVWGVTMILMGVIAYVVFGRR